MTSASRLCVLAVLAVFGARSVHAQTQQNWCGTRQQHEWLMYRVTQMRKSEDSLRLEHPASPRTPETPQPIEVRDQVICERATRKYYRDELGPYPAEDVAVIRFGDRYAVLGGRHGGEFTVLEIYNLNFEQIGGYWS